MSKVISKLNWQNVIDKTTKPAKCAIHGKRLFKVDGKYRCATQWCGNPLGEINHRHRTMWLTAEKRIVKKNNSKNRYIWERGSCVEY